MSLRKWSSSDRTGVVSSAGGSLETCVEHEGSNREFTTADSPQFNGVAERALGLIETAAMAGRIQARELYPGAQLPATDSLWAEASHWACDALNRTATTANPESKSPYEMWYGRPPPVVLLPFLKPGYCKVKRENKAQAKAQECFYLGPAPNYPRDSVRVLTRHRTVLITRNITWQRVSPEPPVPAQMNDSLSMEEGGSEANDGSTSDQGGRGVVDELDEGLACLNDLDLTWGSIWTRFWRSAPSRHLPPAMPVTGQTRRWVRLEGARWTPPRPL